MRTFGHGREPPYSMFFAWAATAGGATAVEYGLIMALVVLTMMVGLRETAKVTIGMWNDVSTKVQKR